MEENIIKVAEPAHCPSNGPFVKVAEDGQTLHFPDVDSCLAIIFRLDDGRTVGGHVPLMWGHEDKELNAESNAKRILNEMLQVSERNLVDQVVLVGPEGMWRDNGIVNSIKKNPLLSNASFGYTKTEEIGKVDVHANNKSVVIKNDSSLIANIEFPEVKKYKFG
jgi:hypothetical protein